MTNRQGNYYNNRATHFVCGTVPGSNTRVALHTVDIGLPQLAMHSPYETGGVKDTAYLIRTARELFR